MLTPATSLPRSESRTALEQLRAMLGEPSRWGRARPAIWEASERYLGFRLPADFKAFLDLYGPGSVDGYLTIDRPMDTTPAELERRWGPPPERPAWYGEIDEDCWEVDESDVQSGVLLLWGSDEHGSRYFFRAVEDEPAEWRIIISSDEVEWFETAGTFTEFLVRCFHRIDRPDFMDSSWPRPGARYEARE
ncbi:SMI1/KNR4 family protein [Kitasatospora sp. NPDC059812]|uniref:SMI1/KNR4 family protein n=1 Tax=Kitasatospora sp. NPDC059812 TaxID=3346958 RepID=UPI003653B21B